MRLLGIRITVVAGALIALTVMGSSAAAQRDRDAEEPTAVMSFIVLKDYNGKPVRNAAVIMHPVSTRGKQERGGLELKTDADGRSSLDGIPYGKLRVQVLAQGFQTYGADYEVNQPKLEVTIKLKRPQGQYSVYEDHPSEKKPEKKEEKEPPADPNQKPQ